MLNIKDGVAEKGEEMLIITLTVLKWAVKTTGTKTVVTQRVLPLSPPAGTVCV